MAFDKEGHIRITPAELFNAASNRPIRLVNDVLCQGTPAFFNTYFEYRDFVHDVGERLHVSPFSIWIRGSAQLGFSITPRPNKVWMEFGDGSDLDLAIVDPDHFHLLDVEIRRWERNSGATQLKRVRNLRSGRRFYQYRHDDLPPTDTCKTYKKNIEEIRAKIDRKVTAFFYRDYWSLHERYLKDIRDLIRQNRIGLPLPRHAPAPRSWLSDDDIEPWWVPSSTQKDINLSQKHSIPPFGITDQGLAKLGDLRAIERIWLDGCDISDTGISALKPSPELRFLSLAGTRVTDLCLNQINHFFPNLQTLILDNTTTTEASVKAFCNQSILTTLSVRDCKWSKGKNHNIPNIYGSRIWVVN